MASKIRREDTQQQEENQRLQDTSQEDTKGFKTPAEKKIYTARNSRRNQQQEENTAQIE